MARVRVLTMKFLRVTKIGQSIASMRTTPQVSGLGPVTVYIARFKCRAGLGPDRVYLFQLGSAHQKVAPGRARSTRLHCHLFCRAVLDPGRALSICGSVNVAYVNPSHLAICANPSHLATCLPITSRYLLTHCISLPVLTRHISLPVLTLHILLSVLTHHISLPAYPLHSLPAYQSHLATC